MDHLKSFEGFNFDNLFSDKANLVMRYHRELTDFCNEYLSFLKDDGFRCLFPNVSGSESDNNHLVLSIIKPKDTYSNGFFRWSDVKDDIIPFYTFLQREFNVISSLVVVDYDRHINEVGFSISEIGDKEYDVYRIDIVIEMV